jgi:hypothetical protein
MTRGATDGAGGRLAGRRILIVGAGQQDHGMEDPPIGNGRAMSVLFAREGAAPAPRNPPMSARRSPPWPQPEGADQASFVPAHGRRVQAQVAVLMR